MNGRFLNYFFLFFCFCLVFVLSVFLNHQANSQGLNVYDTVICKLGDNSPECDYFEATGIQQAIDNSKQGEKILLKAGTYVVDSQIDINNKTLTFDGESAQGTIISGENLVFDNPALSVNTISIQGSDVSSKKLQIVKNARGTGLSLNSSGNRQANINIQGYIIKNNRSAITIASPTVDAANIYISNSLITNNQNGITIIYNADVELVNNTISNNVDPVVTNSGSGIRIAEFSEFPLTGVVLSNNIITSNRPMGGLVVDAPKDKIIHRYNIVWDNGTQFSGTNIDPTEQIVDPQFTNDFKLSSSSPAKNTGEPTFNNPDGSRSDIGAYGGVGACNLDTTIAGCQINISPIPITPVASGTITQIQNGGDANSDNKVNLLDFEILRSQFNSSGNNLSADFNKDGQVNILDFNILRDNFGLSQLQM